MYYRQLYNNKFVYQVSRGRTVLINIKLCLIIRHLVCINTHGDSRMIIKMLQKEGWYKADQSGSHIQFRHPRKRGG